MRKLLTIAASSVALSGAGVAHADTVTFNGTLGAVLEADNTAPGATDPGFAGDSFTITLDYDGDTVNSAVITIGGTSDDAEIIRASVIDVTSASSGPLDELEFDLVSTEGPLAGNFDIDFEFFNTALDSESLGDAIAALGDMGSIVCSHFMFNFGGFKYEGTLVDGGITFNPVDPIPVPGAAVLMLSGLAAAGVARRRRQA